jgi:hypothetical protein
LLSDRPCDGGEVSFDWACERDESLLPVVVDWLVVVADFGVPEGADWAFWADGVELGEDVVGDAVVGADEFESV